MNWENVFDYSELKLKYPRVYLHPIRCGFYCPADWMEIIDRLSSRIESYLELHPEIDFRVDQVKEKFWGLRFYVSVSDPVIDGYILDAEREVKKLVDADRSL
jgi:hypothetical protein